MRRKTRPLNWNSRKRFKRRKRPQKHRLTLFEMIHFFFRTFEAALSKASRRIIVPIVSRKRTIRGMRMPRAPKPLSVTDIWQKIVEKPRPSRCIFFHKQTKVFVFPPIEQHPWRKYATLHKTFRAVLKSLLIFIAIVNRLTGVRG